MNLTVKTLKGEKFSVDAEPSNTVAEVKTIIVSSYVYLLFIKSYLNSDGAGYKKK